MTSPGVKFDMLAAYRAQTAEIARLRGLLERLEQACWSQCQVCGGSAGTHKDCWLDAELHRQQPADHQRI